MKEDILQIASDLREGYISLNEAKAKLLRLFGVNGQLPPPNCSKCGRSGYSTGKPFCTDDFCNGGNLRKESEQEAISYWSEKSPEIRKMK